MIILEHEYRFRSKDQRKAIFVMNDAQFHFDFNVDHVLLGHHGIVSIYSDKGFEDVDFSGDINAFYLVGNEVYLLHLSILHNKVYVLRHFLIENNADKHRIELLTFLRYHKLRGILNE